MTNEVAVIVGAGPAGLTAAYELLTRTSIRPVVLEQDDLVGGISRTVNYKGNRIDIGGHRFFSKSDRVMQWWLQMLPLQRLDSAQCSITYQNQVTSLAAGTGVDPTTTDAVMLVRPRRSRIYHTGKLFDYPLRLSPHTVWNLGALRTARIGLSYLHAQVFPCREEENLEQFLVNRFGRELYRAFFETYTEKVWGMPCRAISAEWGAQRIKGLSVGKAVRHALTRFFRRNGTVGQKGVETSLIEQFLYPKLGPGQMWETCAGEVERLGGKVLLNRRVDRLHTEGSRVRAVTTTDRLTGEKTRYEADYFFSTMPVKTLVQGLAPEAPSSIRRISEGLVYRDFVTVGVLLDEMLLRDDRAPWQKHPLDTWIYVQEPDVQIGRLQIFNNWSPYLLADPDTVWLGAEYFCNQGDAIWSLSDQSLADLCVEELSRVGMVDPAKVLDRTVIRIPKTYPAYFGTYDRFSELRGWLDDFENLFLLGRNGMHRYNNQDHSMLTAMVAVDNLMEGRIDKGAIWEVNTERDYHEAK